MRDQGFQDQVSGIFEVLQKYIQYMEVLEANQRGRALSDKGTLPTISSEESA